jgi:hypothetical protein
VNPLGFPEAVCRWLDCVAKTGLAIVNAVIPTQMTRAIMAAKVAIPINMSAMQTARAGVFILSR